MTHYFIRRLRHICLLISAWLFWRETFITESMYVLERQFFHQLSVKKAEQRVNMRKTILHSRHHIIPCDIIIRIAIYLRSLKVEIWLLTQRVMEWSENYKFSPEGFTLYKHFLPLSYTSETFITAGKYFWKAVLSSTFCGKYTIYIRIPF